MSLLAIAAGVQAAYGLGQAIVGGVQANRAKKETAEARDQSADVSYADSSQPYYDRLENRAQFGLEAEQKQFLNQQADRSSAIGLRGAEDRRAGLMGLGKSTQRLSDAYRQNAMMDIQEKQRKQEVAMDEMGKRAQATYDEESALANLDLSIARGNRQEANRLVQAGMQTAVSGLGSLAYAQEDEDININWVGKSKKAAGN